MIISDPEKNPDCILVVAFTSYEPYKDLACVIEQGEHPRCKHKTVIWFENAMFLQKKEIDGAAADGAIEWNEPLSPVLLTRIRQAAFNSRMRRDSIYFLIEQGLINTKKLGGKS